MSNTINKISINNQNYDIAVTADNVIKDGKTLKSILSIDMKKSYMTIENFELNKNVNRIVTVDLESFAMKAVDVSVTFDFPLACI